MGKLLKDLTNIGSQIQEGDKILVERESKGYSANLSEMLATKADADHSHDEYLTELPEGLATETYVNDKVAALVDGAPDALNTLDELAAALKDNKDIVDVLNNSISTKQDKIDDLATIRSGAALGATALQSETYKGTVTSVKINGTTKNPSNGVVDLGIVITSHQDISGKADKSSLATVATSGSYNDLSNKPTIPAAVTESTVSGWGFTKNTGTYSKPSNGIPKSDLASDVQASLGKADTALQSIPSEYVTESELTSELNKKVDVGNAVTKSYVDRQVNAALSGSGIIPSYVTTGCERIAENILRTRNAYSFVMGAISDLHTTGSDSSASGVEHACLAFNEINKLTQLDMIANLGDVMKGYMDDINDEGFKFVKQQMDAVAKSVPLLQLEGNHDDLSDLSTEDMKQKAFAYIGANNVNVVTDFNNRYRNYGYKDFDDLRFRVIYLNTTDCTEYEVTENIRISPTQLSWLVNTATNFSNKTEPSTWHFIVLSHVPLNAQYESIAALQTILKAMVSKSSGTVRVEGTNISYNFGSLAQKLVCHIHGHIHNFRTEWFGDLLSITVPNACFERNNEYGMLHESETIRNIFGDVDKNGNQRQFNKTQASGEDTAFNVFVIDSRVNNKIYAYNYGAGINRTINLTTKEITESSYESIGGEILPDGIYINSIPLSTIIGGSEIYNDGLGYKNDTYISSSSGGDSSTVNHFATGVMHYPMQLNYTPDIYILGADVNLDDSYTRMGFYKETGLVRFVSTNDISNYFEVVKLADKYYKLKVLYRGNDKSDGQGMSNIGYNHGVISGVRISLPGTGEDVIVSIQNPIVSSIFEGIEWVEYTNQVPTSQDMSGNIYNEGLGYKEDYRLGSSSGESTNTGSIISGFIPYNGEVIRAYGSTSFKPDATGYYIIFYDSAFNMKLCAAATRINSDPGVYFEEIDRRCVFTIDPSLATASDLKSATTYPWFRVSLPLCSHHKFAVTLNEKLIVETETDE